MDRTIETKENRSKYKIWWSAELYEKTYCLYCCEHCGKVTLTPVTVHLSVSSTKNKTEEDVINAVTKSAETALKRLAYSSSRSVSDLLDARLSQKCGNCMSEPEWLSLDKWAHRQAAIWFCICMCILVPPALYIASQIWYSSFLTGFRKGSYSRHAHGRGSSLPLFVLVIGTLGIFGGLFLWGAIDKHFSKRVSFRVNQSFKTTLPLYGETVKDIEVQARNIPQYQDLAFDSIREQLSKNPDGFVID